MRIADAVKREQRGCDKENDQIHYEWAPELKRCPKSLLTEEVAQMILWFDDWRRFRILPFGAESLNDEPAIVYDVLKLCGDVHDQVDQEIVSRG